MGVLFDTSVLIQAERYRVAVESLVHGREDEPFGISVMTVAELLHGVHRADTSKRRLSRQAYVEKVFDLFPVHPFDLPAARLYAEMWARLARRGVVVGAHDLMIAATAASLGFDVVTSNLRDFKKIPGITVHQV